ncbi:MAG TPA: TolC family protein [Pyrinomonadaceae bacterium]|jgi:cobalt-zinc-cadmium efflux system outer membrane protein|nr:TolC family protein [Pyrinomonadaceae bacterium]
MIRKLLVALLILTIQALSAPESTMAQVTPVIPAQQNPQSSISRYYDPSNGLSADDAVSYALVHNGELAAFRSELEAARGLFQQASLRPNPQLEIERKEQVNGSDNDTMVGAMLPLELGGRRSARILVAQRELELKQSLLADQERLLAAEVRAKFGEALGELLKLGFTEDLLTTTDEGYRLVAARVTEGRTAPLEQNMVLVEVNRIRFMRESGQGKVEVAMLELRNLMGMSPEEPLRLRGDLDHLIEPVPSVVVAKDIALRERPDLRAARALEDLAEARIVQARSQGRLDASLTGKYELMNFGFPQQGFNSNGELVPIQGRFHSLAVGVTLDLPVRNRNQGAIAAAVAEKAAATQRREFAELTVQREVASALARYQSAARAAEIYRVGVQEQANANLDVIRQTYELGSKTLLDVIAEQRRFIETQTGYIEALVNTYQARVEIERATASPNLIKK